MAEWSRAWNILAESFVNEKLLRISKDPLHIHRCICRFFCLLSNLNDRPVLTSTANDTTALHVVQLRLCSAACSVLGENLGSRECR